MPVTQPDQVGQTGRATQGERLEVIDLQALTNVAPGYDAGRIRSIRALRSEAGIVRPAWATVVTSFPSVTRMLRIESTASRRAAPTGIGPMPGISQSSPDSRWPLTRAPWSTRTWTMAEGPPCALSVGPRGPRGTAAVVGRGIDVGDPADQADQGIGGDGTEGLVEAGPSRLAGQSA